MYLNWCWKKMMMMVYVNRILHSICAKITAYSSGFSVWKWALLSPIVYINVENGTHGKLYICCCIYEISSFRIIAIKEILCASFPKGEKKQKWKTNKIKKEKKLKYTVYTRQTDAMLKDEIDLNLYYLLLLDGGKFYLLFIRSLNAITSDLFLVRFCIQRSFKLIGSLLLILLYCLFEWSRHFLI